MRKIEGIVVLYNPDDIVLDNIASYINLVNKLYVFDNSDIKNIDLVKKIKNINGCFYIDGNGNKGIAYALNIGAQMAIDNGAKWLLTMDQDSRFIDNGLEKLIDYIKTNDVSSIGIASPVHLTVNKKCIVENSISEELTVMTSGNLLNLYLYTITGPFNEDYFIDCVDLEYCLRLSQNMFRVITLNNSLLKHPLGDTKIVDILGIKKIQYTNHNPLRRYYITRNRLYLIKRYLSGYPAFCLMVLKVTIFDWIKIILFEPEKIKKQKAILRGVYDFTIGKIGKYEN